MDRRGNILPESCLHFQILIPKMGILTLPQNVPIRGPGLLGMLPRRSSIFLLVENSLMEEKNLWCPLVDYGPIIIPIFMTRIMVRIFILTFAFMCTSTNVQQYTYLYLDEFDLIIVPFISTLI